MEEKKACPNEIFCAILQTFKEPMFVIDKDENIIMNDEAQKLRDNGLDLLEQSKKVKDGSSKLISHKNNKYRLSKNVIDIGNNVLFKLSLEDETIARLHKSNLRLKKVLSSI